MGGLVLITLQRQQANRKQQSRQHARTAASPMCSPDSPFWIGNLYNSEFRCLIPATRFMLWGSGTDYEGQQLRHRFGLEGAPVFALAGVWTGEEVPAFALLSR